MPKGFRKSDGKPIGCVNKGRPSPRKNGIMFPCIQCGNKFYVIKSRIGIYKFCSQKCMGENKIGKPINLGKNNGNYKGEKHIGFHGYILVLKRNHPFCDINGYVKEHRLVMEQKIGRYLRPEEVVHHINHIRNDNCIDNLMLFANDSEHHKFHKPKGTKFPRKIN